jgi:hypothetical protein
VKLLAVAATALALAAPAQAAAWKRVTTADSQVAAVRTGDGVLHVVWHDGDDLFHTAIRAGGKVGATRPIVTGSGVQDPAVVALPDGLQAFWSADDGLDTAFSPDEGTSWQLTHGAIAAGGGPVSATADLQAWGGTWVHAGEDPSTPSVDYGPGSSPQLATNKAGRTMMAWLANGVVAQRVNADGTPDGPLMTMPGPPAGRISLAAGAKGFFVASGPNVWPVGAGSMLALGRGHAVSLAADAKGRVWAVWASRGHVYAARSDREVSEFGARVDAGRVADTVQATDASALGSSLDVLARFGGATYVKRVRPGLTLVARRRGNQVTFSVTDADNPVRGARVRVAGRTKRTDRAGRTTITVRVRATAVATHSGYTRAKLKVSGV